MTLSQFQTYLSIAKDIFTVLASIIAGVVAIIGLQTWRKQLVGKTEYELAQKVLKMVYKLREDFYEIRYPKLGEDEMVEGARNAQIDSHPFSKENRGKLYGAIYQARLRKMQEDISQWELLFLEAEALWGDIATKKFDVFTQHIKTLYFPSGNIFYSKARIKKFLDE